MLAYKDIQIALLSFGMKGMELICSDVDTDLGLDEEYITLIANYYSNVLQQQREESKGIYGALPVFYREKYDLLILMYGFPSYDPDMKDERVIKHNYIVKAQLLIFFSAKLDGYISQKKFTLKELLDIWVISKEKTPIKDTKPPELFKLKKMIIEKLNENIEKDKLSREKEYINNLIISTNFEWLIKYSSIVNKQVRVSFFIEIDRYLSQLVSCIFQKNTYNLLVYKKLNNTKHFNFGNLTIEIVDIHSQDGSLFGFKGNFDAGMLISEVNEDENSKIHFITLSEELLDKTDQKLISLCMINKLKDNQIIRFLNKEKYANRSIHLPILDDNTTLADSISSFLEILHSKI